jgi:hypothetical protein
MKMKKKGLTHVMRILDFLKCFTRSIELQPDVGHSKYMYMGQMADGHDAIQFYQTGISLMKKSLSLQAEQVSILNTNIVASILKKLIYFLYCGKPCIPHHP